MMIAVMLAGCGTLHKIVCFGEDADKCARSYMDITLMDMVLNNAGK